MRENEIDTEFRCKMEPNDLVVVYWDSEDSDLSLINHVGGETSTVVLTLKDTYKLHKMLSSIIRGFDQNG